LSRGGLRQIWRQEESTCASGTELESSAPGYERGIKRLQKSLIAWMGDYLRADALNK
jgi:hypothetical protein